MQFMQTDQFMQLTVEHRGPVLSGLTGLVESLYQLHIKTPSTERSDPLAQFISL